MNPSSLISHCAILAAFLAAAPFTLAQNPATAPAAATTVAKFQPGDTLLNRLAALRADVEAARTALSQAPKPVHGGFVEKTLADVDRTLADVGKAVDYVHAHPEIDPLSAWMADDSMRGAMAKTPPVLPLYAGRSGVRRGQYFVQKSAAANSNLTVAYAALHDAWFEFSSARPEVKPYQVGDIGGFRNTIRADLTQAEADLIAGLDYAHAPATPGANGELVVNGDFEKVPTPTGGNIANRNLALWFQDGNEPAGFGWRVSTVNSFQLGDVTVFHQGYVESGPGRTTSYPAPAADGQQFLALTCASDSSSAIVQILPTIPGQQYTLTFAYANNPFASAPGVDPTRGTPHAATVTIKDTADGGDLIKPFDFSHDTATAVDYHWVHADPITFTAKSTRTTLQFTANYHGHDCVFLDSISIKPAAAPTLP